jgi:hypothetical protein
MSTSAAETVAYTAETLIYATYPTILAVHPVVSAIFSEPFVEMTAVSAMHPAVPATYLGIKIATGDAPATQLGTTAICPGVFAVHPLFLVEEAQIPAT